MLIPPPVTTAHPLPPTPAPPPPAFAAGPRGTAVFVTTATAAALILAAGPQAAAAESATSPKGGTLTVSKTQGLNPDGETVTISGTGFGRVRDSGYNGIYVSLCRSQGAGRLATPCVGGADMEGSSGTSLWIGDKVPSYGTGLAKPFNKGAGGFEYQLTLKAKDEFVDCTQVSCVVQVRADHTSSGDRGDDAAVPVTWASGNTGGGATPTATTSGATAATTSGTAGGGSGAAPTTATSRSGSVADGTSGSTSGGTSGSSTSGGTTAAAADSLPKTGGNERAVALAFGAAALVAAGLAVVLATFRRRNTPGAPAA